MVSQYSVPDDAWTNHNISRCCSYDTTPSMILTHFSILNIQGLKPLTVSYLDAEVNIENYYLFLQDRERNKKKGIASRGVAFYIRFRNDKSS